MLQEKILKSLKKLNLDQRRLAKIAGTNESCLSRYLNGFEELHFSSILKIVQYLFPDQEKEVMSEYVVTQKSRNARFALEYCDMNSLSESRKYVIEKLAASSNPVDREWANLYNFMVIMKDGTLSLHSLLSQVELFAPKEIEMKIMKTIVKAYIYGRQKELALQIEGVNQIESFIKQVKSNFLRQCFNIRLGLFMNYTYLYANDLDKARYYSSLIVNQDFFENVKAIAYHHLGHSYLFEDYDTARIYLEKSISLFSKANQESYLNIAKRKLLLLKSYWNEKEGLCPFELKGHLEKSIYIYYLIKQDQIDQAKKLLAETDLNSASDWEKGFHYFHMGLLDRKKETLYHSVKFFQLARDLFHIKFPIQELQKLGEDKEVLEVWSN